MHASRLVLLLLLAAPLWAQTPAPQVPADSKPANSAADSAAQPNPPQPSVPPDSTKLELIKSVKAVYPLDARDRALQGQVMLRVVISEMGDVEETEVLSGDRVLWNAAQKAVKQWKFKPYIRDGKPVKVRVQIPINFAFAGKAEDMPEPKQQEAAKPSGTNSGAVKTVRIQPEPEPQGDDLGGATKSGQLRSIRVSRAVSQGLLIHRVVPVYPPEARANRIQGTVMLGAIIDRQGMVKDLKVISGPPELRESAIGAVQQWRYRPYLLNGAPVEVETQVQVNYQLSY